jgi:hypothetical protein
VIALTVKANDKHWSPMPVAIRLTGLQSWGIATLWSNVADSLAKTAMAKSIGAAKKVDAVVGVIWS